MNWGWRIQARLWAKSAIQQKRGKKIIIWQAVNPNQDLLVWNAEEVWTQLAQKDLHVPPLEPSDANEGGRLRGGSAVCFNSTFLTLLVGENKAFWGPTSPSATRPEGLSRGSVDVQERDWHGSCAKRLQRTFQQTSNHYIRCVLLRGRSRRLFQLLSTGFQRSLSLSDMIYRAAEQASALQYLRLWGTNIV